MAPRLSNVRKPAQAHDHNPKAEPGDNSAAQEEAERVQLISFVSKLTKADGEIEEAKAPFDAAKKARRQIVNLAKAAGFTAKELERRMDEMNDPARENPEKLARETRHRRWLGIINPEQSELQLGAKVPAEAKDEAHWRAEGFKAGLRQMLRTPPTECAERFVQAWMHEYDRGLKEVLEANAPRPMASVASQATADFAEDNPEIDVDAAARKLKANPQFMARGADEPFEADEDELLAQKPRQAVEERREADEAEGEVV